MGRHRNLIKQCPQCGVKAEDGAEFYNGQRICVPCSKKNSRERAEKQKQLFSKARFKTDADFKKWNNLPEHKLRFDTARKNYNIAMGYEDNTTMENVIKDRIGVI